jgi:hypothetical protein
MKSIFKWLRNFGRNQDGTASVEFVFIFPAFMGVFLLGFESGYFMLRGVMLERGVDVAVREVRLANGTVPDLAELKTDICDVALMLPNCEESLQIEIRPVAPVPGGVADLGTEISCIDKRVDPDDVANETTYNTGSGNQLMMVRVCALAEPLFPTTPLGAGLKVDSFGNYALVSTTAFVNEPDLSTDREEVPLSVASGGGGGGAGDGSTTGDGT